MAGLKKTDFIYPATIQNERDGLLWSSPANIKADDGNYATLTGDGVSEHIDALDFSAGFTNFTGSERVVGIEFIIYCHGSADNDVIDNSVEMYYKGYRKGQDHAHNVPWWLSNDFRTHGNPADVWGISPTIWALKDSDFGFSFTAKVLNNATAYIDYVALKAYYLNLDYSDIEIANEALAMISEPPITSFDDDNARARVCKQFYDSARQNTLAEYPWPEALVTTGLMANQTPPVGEYWTYAYSFPINLIKLINIFPQGSIYPLKSDSFEIGAGNVLYTNVEVGEIQYIADLADPGLISPNLRRAIAYNLALMLHPILVNNPGTYLGLYKVASIEKARLFQKSRGHKNKKHFTWGIPDESLYKDADQL